MIRYDVVMAKMMDRDGDRDDDDDDDDDGDCDTDGDGDGDCDDFDGNDIPSSIAHRPGAGGRLTPLTLRSPATGLGEGGPRSHSGSCGRSCLL